MIEISIIIFIFYFQFIQYKGVGIELLWAIVCYTIFALFGIPFYLGYVQSGGEDLSFAKGFYFVYLLFVYLIISKLYLNYYSKIYFIYNILLKNVSDKDNITLKEIFDIYKITPEKMDQLEYFLKKQVLDPYVNSNKAGGALLTKNKQFYPKSDTVLKKWTILRFIRDYKMIILDSLDLAKNTKEINQVWDRFFNYSFYLLIAFIVTYLSIIFLN